MLFMEGRVSRGVRLKPDGRRLKGEQEVREQRPIRWEGKAPAGVRWAFLLSVDNWAVGFCSPVMGETESLGGTQKETGVEDTWRENKREVPTI